MPIRFKCPHCQKTLRVQDNLAGRKAACPACKKPIVIPAPVSAPTDVDALAAQMLGDPPAQKEEVKTPAAKPIKFKCQFCETDVEVPLAEAGKKMPCPECRHIIRVPVPEEDKPKDWRQLIKKGPSAALINQPEQLKDAWGTEQKARVSQKSLVEAGAVADVAVKPVGVGGWIKRGFWTITVVGLSVLAVLGANRSVTDKREKGFMLQAMETIEPKGKVPAKVILNPVWSGEIHRAAGEFYARKQQAPKAKEQLRMALANFPRPGQEVPKEVTEADLDLFLINLALTWIELGGTEEEAREKKLLTWPEIQKELAQNLEAIRSSEARILALRVIGSRLLEKKQLPTAIGLAGPLSSLPDPYRPNFYPLVSQQVGLLLTLNDPTRAEERLKEKGSRPLDPDKGPFDYLARIGYVEGYARKGNYQAALDMALAKGEPYDRLQACLAGATLALAERPARPEALQFVKNALIFKDDYEQKSRQKLSPWLMFQLVQCAGQTEAADQAKELIPQLGPAFQPHAQLVWYRAKLEKTPGFAGYVMVEEVEAKDSWPRALAWEMLARHNARLGLRDDVLRLIKDADNPHIPPFLYAGLALGEQERRQ